MTSFHCSILFSLAVPLVAAPAPVTFSEHIAPIIYEKCGSCHRPGESAPFSLTNFGKCRGGAN